ncbi:hypothetical protein FVE85_8247 [Porphyridium purpureum]|uniref:Uncharacterized protein n=1 Tax=Porphyridium purpureum TaxID=35688 RepID=A0A5J4YKW1_PORPP|nr:hypothetical protein FVE85_8247 [Porphyridium purpureum]|eukprot:POR5601..scf244_11
MMVRTAAGARPSWRAGCVLGWMLVVSVAVSAARQAEYEYTATTTRSSTGSKVVSNEKEAMQLRTKLEHAEGRVRELVSNLEVVSVDASRAKTEIHEMLHEAWSMVDMLSRDKCGDAVETVRIKQREIESALIESREMVEDRERVIAKLEKEKGAAAKVRKELEEKEDAWADERDKLMREIQLEREKVVVAHALFNASSIYQKLHPQFDEVATLVHSRFELLTKLRTMIGQLSGEHDELVGAFSSLETFVKDVDAEFKSKISGLKLSSLDQSAVQKHAAALEARLHEALVERDAAMREVRQVYDSFNAAQGAESHIIAPAFPSSSGSGGASGSGVSSSWSTGWTIFFTFICGAVMMALAGALFFRPPQPMAHQYNGTPNYGSGPTLMRGLGSPSPQGPSGLMSPTRPSALQSPMPSKSGFLHSNRSPMQYVQSRDATPGSVFRR